MQLQLFWWPNKAFAKNSHLSFPFHLYVFPLAQESVLVNTSQYSPLCPLKLITTEANPHSEFSNGTHSCPSTGAPDPPHHQQVSPGAAFTAPMVPSHQQQSSFKLHLLGCWFCFARVYLSGWTEYPCGTPSSSQLHFKPVWQTSQMFSNLPMEWLGGLLEVVPASLPLLLPCPQHTLLLSKNEFPLTA